MSTSSISTTPASTRNFRLLAHTFLLISTNSLTLCLLYTLYISPSKQHLGFRENLAVLQISWLIASSLVLVVSLCYLISSYYRGHKSRMVPATVRPDVETGARETGGERERGGSGREEETGLIAGPPYELQLRPASIFTRALGLTRGGGRNPPSPTLLPEGGGMNVVRERERRHGPVYVLQKPLPPNPPTETGDEDEDEDERRRMAENSQQAPATVPPAVNNLLRIPQNPSTRFGAAVYPGYSTGTSAILPFERVNESSGDRPPGFRVDMQSRAVDGDDGNDNESPGSQPLYAKSEVREVIGRYL